MSELSDDNPLKRGPGRPRRHEDGTVKTSFSLTPEIAAQVDEAARDKNVSRSTIIESALRLYLANRRLRRTQGILILTRAAINATEGGGGEALLEKLEQAVDEAQKLLDSLLIEP